MSFVWKLKLKVKATIQQHSELIKGEAQNEQIHIPGNYNINRVLDEPFSGVFKEQFGIKLKILKLECSWNDFKKFVGKVVGDYLVTKVRRFDRNIINETFLFGRG